MDHLGIDKFMVHGFCIGGPMIWNLLRRAPDPHCRSHAYWHWPADRVLKGAATFSTRGPNMKNWGPELVASRPGSTYGDGPIKL